MRIITDTRRIRCIMRCTISSSYKRVGKTRRKKRMMRKRTQ
jgi:hypothetical protein